MKYFARATVVSLSSIVFLFSSLFCNPASAQSGANKNGLSVHVQEASGGPLSESAIVAISSAGAGYMQTSTTAAGGIANFTGMPPGSYTIKVSAAGYQPAQDTVDIELGRGLVESFITMTRANDSTGAKTAPGVPLLTGDARKELDAAMKSLQSNDVADASAHIAIALKSAPAHPDVQYIAGLCALAQRDTASAQKYYETAIGIYPNHMGAQIGLGTIFLQQNDTTNAIAHFEKALSVDNNSWRAHWLVAEAYLSPGQTQDIVKAKANANRAIELGGEKSVDAEVTLARAEILAGDKDSARTRLEKFIHDYPTHGSVPRAQQMLRALNATPTPPPSDVKP
jgi:cytochrome c-type biogenesis protein CcmH/NrfG